MLLLYLHWCQCLSSPTFVSDACLENPCYNGGTCVDSGSSTKCLCLPTYGGDMCQTGTVTDFMFCFLKDNVEIINILLPLMYIFVSSVCV